MQLYDGLHHATLSTAQDRLSTVYVTYYAAKPDAAEMRDAHLQSLVVTMLQDGQQGTANTIKARLKREQKSSELGRAARRICQPCGQVSNHSTQGP